VVRHDRFTPTYYKPVLRLPGGGLRELERMDHKNRRPLRREVEEELISRVRALIPAVNAVIVQDQAQEPECGVITRRTREALGEMLGTHEAAFGFVDSRVRVGEFRNMIVKPNREEACAAVHPGSPFHAGKKAIICASELSARVGAPVFLTMGEEGIALATQGFAQLVPTAQLQGELDIVGAGDSATAGIVSAFCAGASLEEAAVLGNIVASITVQQIGTTGTTTQDQVRQRFAEHEAVWRDLPAPEVLP